MPLDLRKLLEDLVKVNFEILHRCNEEERWKMFTYFSYLLRTPRLPEAMMGDRIVAKILIPSFFECKGDLSKMEQEMPRVVDETAGALERMYRNSSDPMVQMLREVMNEPSK